MCNRPCLVEKLHQNTCKHLNTYSSSTNNFTNVKNPSGLSMGDGAARGSGAWKSTVQQGGQTPDTGSTWGGGKHSARATVSGYGVSTSILSSFERQAIRNGDKAAAARAPEMASDVQEPQRGAWVGISSQNWVPTHG